MLKAVPRPSRAISQIHPLPEGVVLRSEYALTRVLAVDRNILRVTTTRRESFAEAPSPFIERNAAIPASVQEHDISLTLPAAPSSPKARANPSSFSRPNGSRGA